MAAIAICLTILRSNLFQPPVDRKVITDRVELEELIDNMSLHHNLKSLISRFLDLLQGSTSSI